MKANARIDVNLVKHDDTWQTIAEFVHILDAYSAAAAIPYGPLIGRVRILTRTENGRWTCDYNRPAASIRAEQEEED